jgi:hypothetical protein
VHRRAERFQQMLSGLLKAPKIAKTLMFGEGFQSTISVFDFHCDPQFGLCFMSLYRFFRRTERGIAVLRRQLFRQRCCACRLRVPIQSASTVSTSVLAALMAVRRTVEKGQRTTEPAHIIFINSLYHVISFSPFNFKIILQ